MKNPLALLIVFTASRLSAGWGPFTETPRIGPAAFNQTEASIASNGFDYLAAWTTDLPNGSSVSAVRVNSDGTMATTLPVPLDPNARGVNISAARDGYFASWISDSGLNAAIMDSYGRIEQRTTIAQPGVTATVTAWNGAVHLVLAQSDGPFTASLFDDNGDVIQSAIPVGDTHGDANARLALTVDGAGFLVLSTKEDAVGHDELYARRISSSGVSSDWFLVRSMVTHVLGLAATSDGTRDIIVWGDGFGVWTTSIDIASNATAPSRQLTSDSARATDVLIASGRTWIAYQNFPSGGGAYIINVDAQGAVSAPAPLSGPSTLATNGTTILCASVAQGPMDLDVEGAFLTATDVGAPFVISMSETAQNHGTLSSDGKTTIAVWDEAIGASHQIFAARFDASSLDPTGIQISSSGDNIDPDVAYNGMASLIVWTRGGEVLGRRLASDGTLLDTNDIRIGDGTAFGAPRVVWDGSGWFVVWVRAVQESPCAAFGTATRVYAAHVSPGGVVLEAGGVQLDPAPLMDQLDVDLDRNGSEYVVAWMNQCAQWHGPTSTAIEMAAVSRDLSSVRSGIVATSGSNPRIAAGADRSLVAWTTIGQTEFRLVDNSLPEATRRRRAFVGQPGSFRSIPGSLIAVDAQDIFTQMTIPNAAPYQGLYDTTLAPDETSATPRMLFVLEPNETLMGRLILQNGWRWMTESMLNSVFDPAAGAPRLWIREF